MTDAAPAATTLPESTASPTPTGPATVVALRPPLASVALLSASALASEILLTRLFAVVHWHHFAYMILSLALLGFGASGTFLALAHRRLLRHFATAYLVNVAAFGVLVVACPALGRALPFQAEALLWDPRQPLWLVLLYLVLAVPFFCAANAIGLALVAFRDRAGRVYAADLIGAGLGSVAVLALLYLLWPEAILRIIGVAGLLAACVGAIELRSRPKAWSIAALAAMAVVALVPAAALRFEPGSYKSLTQALRIDGTRIALERSGPLGRVTVTENIRVPLRWAPGLSLNATGEPPPQLGLFTDGDDLQAITAASDDGQRLAFLAETTAAVAYHVREPREVLVLGAGGGMEILRAWRLGARVVDAVELNPQVVELLQREYRDYTGNLVGQSGVSLHVGEARGFLRGADRRYDLIQMAFAGGGSGGLGGLNEDYVHTVEAFRLYLAHLQPGGFLAITRGTQIPPRDALKLVATVRAALESEGVTDAADRLIAIRGWQAVTLLVKNGRVTEEEKKRLREFCEALSFDVVWYPGIDAREVNVYNELPEDWYFDGVRALLGPERNAFIVGYPYDIRPATDDRPYFRNFFRWRVLAEAWGARDRGGMALLEAGYLLLAATLLQALATGLVLILLPLVLFAPLTRIPGGRRLRVFAYFTGIGLAFMFVEIAFLQKLVLLVHHPTVALALVLATFLLGAGAGSGWSSRIAPERGRLALGVAVAVIVVLGVLYGVVFDALIATLATWPVYARAIVASALLAPLAFCMGLPFPLALRTLEQPLVPWAWGINGCASVVSAVLATLLAVDFGFSTVLWLALALYVAVLGVAWATLADSSIGGVAPRADRAGGNAPAG